MKKNTEKGQALITLIFFTVIAVIIITAAVSVVFTNNLSTTNSELGLEAYYAGEAGAEDGLLRRLRDPNYSGSYDITEGIDATVEIDSVAGTIVSTGRAGTAVTANRKIRIQTVYTDGKITISSWKEI